MKQFGQLVIFAAFACASADYKLCGDSLGCCAVPTMNSCCMFDSSGNQGCVNASNVCPDVGGTTWSFSHNNVQCAWAVTMCPTPTSTANIFMAFYDVTVQVTSCQSAWGDTWTLTVSPGEWVATPTTNKSRPEGTGLAKRNNKIVAS